MFGPASEEELALLYNAAWVLPFPSIYEGFGFPLLEAMACGTPVVTTRVSAMPEVAGDAALYFEPGDDAALAAHLLRLATDPELRQSLGAVGRQRAAGFTWRAAAEKTAAVYHRALR